MELPAYHPFRSAKAKEQYLALYDLRAKRWPVASETRMLETSYGQTFVRISGATNAQPLVLLPGIRANSLMWTPNIEALSACYRTYAVDNIYDVGRSIYTRPLKSSGNFVNWLEELQSLKVPTLYLVGEHEKIYSAQKAVQRLNTVAPQIKTEIIPHAGHDLAGVQAEMVNRKVLEFLKQP